MSLNARLSYMTNKSLLTQQYIKNFIYETIEKIHPREPVYYCLYPLSRILGISVYNLKQYTNKGMPCVRYRKTKRYNITKVIEWLDKNNISFKLNYNS